MFSIELQYLKYNVLFYFELMPQSTEMAMSGQQVNLTTLTSIQTNSTNT